MNAIISVVGKDTTRNLASVSNDCTLKNANIIDVSQSI